MTREEEMAPDINSIYLKEDMAAEISITEKITAWLTLLQMLLRSKQLLAPLLLERLQETLAAPVRLLVAYPKVEVEGKGRSKDPSGPTARARSDADGLTNLRFRSRGREDDPMRIVFMEEILLFLDHGRAPKFDYEAKALADELGWSMGEKYKIAALGRLMMPFAKTNHTYKSQVTVNWGDARYAIMPLLLTCLTPYLR